MADTPNICSALKRTNGGHCGAILGLCLIAVAGAGCSESGPTKGQLLSRADTALAEGRYLIAEKSYREALRLAPADPTILRQLATLYFDQGQLIQAYPLLRQVAKLNPEDMGLQLKLGLALLALGQLPQAREAAQQVLEKEPGNEPALLLLVDTPGTTEEASEVRTFIEELRQRDHDRASYHVALGLLDLRRQDLAAAESKFKTALEMDAKTKGAHLGLGTVYWSRGDLKAADEAMKTAVDLSDPRSPMLMRYVDFKLRTGSLPEAKSILEDIANKFPEYLPPRVYLMRMACGERRNEDCAARVQNILAQDQTNFEALLQDSLLSLTKGDPEKAIRELEYLSDNYRQNAQVRYQLAVAYLVAGDSTNRAGRHAAEMAESRLSEAIQLDPRFERAVLLHAELKIRRGEAAVVIDSLERLLRERPNSAETYYLLGSAYVAVQKRDEAVAVYRRLAGLFPQDAQAPFLAGSILFMQGQQLEARKELEKSLEISPNFLPATEALVTLDLANQQYTTAVDRVQKQIEKSPERAQVWALRARIYLAQHNITGAEADLLRAIELDPKLEPAYLLLAELYVSSDRPNRAIETLSRLVEKNKSVPALMQLAAIQEQVKNFAAARDAYQNLLAVAPDFAPALNNLAMLQSERLGQLDVAYDLAKKAREAAPNEPSIAETLGWILFKKADYGTALRHLQEAANNLTDRPEVQFHLGMAHYMLGEDGAAREALEKAVSASGDFPGKEEARGRLAVLAIDAGTADIAARSDLEGFLRERPNDPVALVRLARFQIRAGDVDQAFSTLEKAVADNPHHGPALRQLALLYGERSADGPKAYEVVQKARQSYPDDANIADALGWILFRRADYANALRQFLEAAGKLPEKPQVQFHLGMAHYMLGEEGAAREALQKTADSSADFSGKEEARQRLAVLAIDVGTASAAAPTELDTFLKQWPNDPAALVRLASIQAHDGTVDQAVKTLEKVVADHPLYPLALRRLALLYGERSANEPTAYEVVQRARQSYPDDAGIAKALGILSYRRELYGRAAELLEEADRRRKDDPELLYYLGSAHHQLRHWKECKAALENALRLDLLPALAETAKHALADCSESAAP